jgi:hypothetical protein
MHPQTESLDGGDSDRVAGAAKVLYHQLGRPVSPDGVLDRSAEVG